jgi:hypothetical protein
MNRMTIVSLCLMATFTCAFTDWAPMARVTIEVVDEEGKPVPDAKVSVAGGDGQGQALHTDRDGRVIATLKSVGSVGGGVRKDGFYTTAYRFSLFDHVPEGVTVGRRYPDVTHRVVIRPKLKPVPMYAYQFSRAIPVEGEEIGIDLLKADWVAPHGKGEVADVMVNMASSPDSGPTITYGEFAWRFPRAGDGMVRVPLDECHPNSDFIMPRYAPNGGYIAEWKAKRTRGERTWLGETQPDGPEFDSAPYFFRIRSRLNEKGQVVEALYGKITKPQGSITWRSIYQDRPARVNFTYHVNPDGTRNLEYDPERNLFTDPPWDRRNFPRQP